MWFPRYRRRRNPASFLVAFAIVLCFVGYDQLTSELQKRQEWSGTIVRVYDHKPFYAKSRSHNYDRYWDVRTTDGDVRSVRIRPRSCWSEAGPGDPVVKRAGDLNPALIAHRR